MSDLPTSSLSKALESAGAPSNGTSEVQTITISSFGACTLSIAYKGAGTTVVFAGTEINSAIDTAVTAALVALITVGAGGVTTSTSGTTDRAIAVTFAANLGKLDTDLLTVSVSGGAALFATYSTNLTGSNNDLTLTAVGSGTGGNSITATYTDPSANNQTLSVSVTGTAVNVLLATGSGGAITSTAALIRAALIASTPAAALIVPTLKTGNDGTGVVTAMTVQSLTGGLAAPSVANAVTTPGVTASGRGQAAKGQTLIDSTNGVPYINQGTILAPTWVKVSAT